MSKACSNCNAENVDEAKFCRNCGTSSFQVQEYDNEVHERNDNLEIKEEYKVLSKLDRFNISFFFTAIILAILSVFLPWIKNDLPLPVLDSLRIVLVMSIIPGLIGIFIPSKTIKKHLINTFNLLVLVLVLGIAYLLIFEVN